MINDCSPIRCFTTFARKAVCIKLSDHYTPHESFMESIIKAFALKVNNNEELDIAVRQVDR